MSYLTATFAQRLLGSCPADHIMTPGLGNMSSCTRCPKGKHAPMKGIAVCLPQAERCPLAQYQFVRELAPNYDVISTFGTVGSAKHKWSGGALAPNNIIIGIPFNARHVLMIDADAELAYALASSSTTTSADLGKGGNKWMGAVLTGTGLVLGVPYSSPWLLSVDAVNKGVRLHSAGTNLGGAYGDGLAKWMGGVLSTRGTVIAIPFDSDRVGVFRFRESGDIVAAHGSADSRLSGTSKWSFGVLSPQGHIYGIPSRATKVLKVEPGSANRISFVEIAGKASERTAGTGAKWRGGVLSTEGIIYAVPYYAKTVLRINPATDTASTIGGFGSGPKWWGAVLSPHGHVYAMPASASQVMRLQELATGTPQTSTTVFGSVLGGDDKFWGGVASARGTIIAIPSSSNSVLRIGEPVCICNTSAGHMCASKTRATVGTMVREPLGVSAAIVLLLLFFVLLCRRANIPERGSRRTAVAGPVGCVWRALLWLAAVCKACMRCCRRVKVAPWRRPGAHGARPASGIGTSRISPVAPSMSRWAAQGMEANSGPQQERSRGLQWQQCDQPTNQGMELHSIQCMICLQNVRVSAEDHFITPCCHHFHRECILTWLQDKSTCPICKREQHQISDG